jgi:hypothetical protein
MIDCGGKATPVAKAAKAINLLDDVISLRFSILSCILIY